MPCFLVLVIGLEPIRPCEPRDFKSLASAYSATPAYLVVYLWCYKNFGGTTQNRTGDKSFADFCLTAWRWCHKYKSRQVLLPASLVERETRFELATFALARQRSTTEPFPHPKRRYMVETIGLEPMTLCL